MSCDSRVRPGDKDAAVAPELVDHVTGDVPLVGRIKQGQGAQQRREHAAPVYVADDQDRKIRGPGQPHVGDVPGPQFELGGAASALADDDVIACAQGGQAIQDDIQQLQLELLVGARVRVAPGLAEHDHLGIWSLAGFSRTGFISLVGATRAAAACMAWARPISAPSAVTMLLSACSAQQPGGQQLLGQRAGRRPRPGRAQASTRSAAVIAPPGLAAQQAGGDLHPKARRPPVPDDRSL